MNASSAPVVLITGAARRLGAVIAEHLHAAGYAIALHYRHSGREAAALGARLQAIRPGSCVVLPADLNDLAQLPVLIDRVLTHFGRLDALINNASAFYPTRFGSVAVADWDDLFASNAKAPFFLAQAAAPALKAAHGTILNLIDIYAERPLAAHSVYCMAKAALAMMTLSLAKELAPEVRVNGIAPGAVLWPETGKEAGDQAELIAKTPLRRVGSPADIAGAALFFLRDAPFVTGQILRVDGGRAL